MSFTINRLAWQILNGDMLTPDNGSLTVASEGRVNAASVAVNNSSALYRNPLYA